MTKSEKDALKSLCFGTLLGTVSGCILLGDGIAGAFAGMLVWGMVSVRKTAAERQKTGKRAGERRKEKKYGKRTISKSG